MLQIKNAAPRSRTSRNYFSTHCTSARTSTRCQPLKAGAKVVAGTILGRLGAGTPQLASHLQFMVRPAGKNAPYIDPKPILDGWKLLEATARVPRRRVNPFFGQHARTRRSADPADVQGAADQPGARRPARTDLRVRPAHIEAGRSTAGCSRDRILSASGSTPPSRG